MNICICLPIFLPLRGKRQRGVQNCLGILLWQRHRKICMLSTPNFECILLFVIYCIFDGL